MIDAYLDIETTGLSPSDGAITVIGIHLVNGGESSLVQLVGEAVTGDNLLAALDGVHTIFTYNGSRFDLPFIHACLGVNLASTHRHHDLMYDCWDQNLYGGFKAVESLLGISRQLKDVSGFEAVRLWWRYSNDGDQQALGALLDYNREDVVNLEVLRDRLGIDRKCVPEQ